eukprot:GHVT01039479.1.p1 GENE.GHVT01039479.1~~GHVT01039479.1.p1  ORF type:complete len:445 (-),score=39.05 GHVT01039479.1:827-2161(-)
MHDGAAKDIHFGDVHKDFPLPRLGRCQFALVVLVVFCCAQTVPGCCESFNPRVVGQDKKTETEAVYEGDVTQVFSKSVSSRNTAPSQAPIHFSRGSKVDPSFKTTRSKLQEPSRPRSNTKYYMLHIVLPLVLSSVAVAVSLAIFIPTVKHLLIRKCDDQAQSNKNTATDVRPTVEQGRQKTPTGTNVAQAEPPTHESEGMPPKSEPIDGSPNDTGKTDPGQTQQSPKAPVKTTPDETLQNDPVKTPTNKQQLLDDQAEPPNPDKTKRKESGNPFISQKPEPNNKTGKPDPGRKQQSPIDPVKTTHDETLQNDPVKPPSNKEPLPAQANPPNSDEAKPEQSENPPIPQKPILGNQQENTPIPQEPIPGNQQGEQPISQNETEAQNQNPVDQGNAKPSKKLNGLRRVGSKVFSGFSWVVSKVTKDTNSQATSVSVNQPASTASTGP